MDHVSKSLKYGGIAVAGVCAMPMVAGFRSAGIVGGSIAALVQSKSLKYGGIAVASVCAVPMVAGFGSAGIVGGSIAALVQSSIGSVAAGSTFAALQSLGATGVFATGATAGGTAAGTGYIAHWWSKKKKKTSDKD